MRVSEIRVNQIRVNQGLGVYLIIKSFGLPYRTSKNGKKNLFSDKIH